MSGLVEYARKYGQPLKGVLLAADDEIKQLTTERDKLKKAAQAVVDRWDSPNWKDQPHTGNYISDLREALKESAWPTCSTKQSDTVTSA